MQNLELTLSPVRTAGFLLSPAAVTCAVLSMDKKRGVQHPDVPELDRSGQFWKKAAVFTVPCAGPCRLEEALDYLQYECGMDVNQAPGFHGQLSALCPDRASAEPGMDAMAINGTLYWIAPGKDPGLFHAAYPSPDDLLHEFKAGFGQYWPDTFPWWDHIAEIYGVYLP